MDVAVVGAGLTGLSAALHLARKGVPRGTDRPEGCWAARRKFTRGLGEAAAREGVEIHEKAPAPVESFIVVTEPLGTETCDEIMPIRRMAPDSKNLLSYFRITANHRLLFGGRARFAMSNPQWDEKRGRILQKAMTSVFPQLANARWTT